MPYIDQARREELLDCHDWPETPGELNFLITNQLNRYVTQQRLSYQTINDCLGALEGAKLEFYRRIVVPYEEKKRLENGDVYPPN